MMRRLPKSYAELVRFGMPEFEVIRRPFNVTGKDPLPLGTRITASLAASLFPPGFAARRIRQFYEQGLFGAVEGTVVTRYQHQPRTPSTHATPPPLPLPQLPLLPPPPLPAAAVPPSTVASTPIAAAPTPVKEVVAYVPRGSSFGAAPGRTANSPSPLNPKSRKDSRKGKKGKKGR